MSSETAGIKSETKSRLVPDAGAMHQPALVVRDLGKCYHIYRQPKDKLKEVLSFGRGRYHRKFWALRDVSLDVRKGETLGIVGRNGSGKSTLLQIIAGTVAPTTGRVEMQGRVAALLELGSGFNPEFTGRENVYMNATLLGLSRSEIDERYDAIVRFADIGDFIEQPVKTYSSGMYVRLAFAVAVSVDPDILVIDEALAVGDEMFQRKCFARMHAIRERGTTILFVSHSATAIVELCDRATLLDSGEAILSGVPKLVVAKYHQLSFAPEDRREGLRKEIFSLRKCGDQISSVDGPESRVFREAEARKGTAYYDPTLVPQTTVAYESTAARIDEPCLLTLDGRMVNNLVRRHDYIYRYTVHFLEPASSVRAAMLLKTLRGVELGGTLSSKTSQAIDRVDTGTTLHVDFKFTCLLSPGTYFLNAGVVTHVNGALTLLARCIDAVVFRVQPEEDTPLTGAIDFFVEPSLRLEKPGHPTDSRTTKV